MDQDQVRPVLDARGPFASVFWEDSFNTEDAARQLDLKSREIAAGLGEQGADEATIDAVVTAVLDGDHPVGAGGRGVVAAQGRVLLDQRLAAPPARQVARVSELPYLLPFISHGGAGVSYVVVAVDHRGADLVEHDEHGREVGSETVAGEQHQVHHVRGGGFAHASMRGNVDEARDQNLVEVAERVAERVGRSRPGRVFLVGEQQSRRALHAKLPPAVRAITEELSAGGRAAGAGRDEVEREIREALARYRLAGYEELAERFRMGVGRADGLAVTGLDEVARALSEANVDTALIGDPGDAEVWVGASPGEIAVDEGALRAFGVGSRRKLRADEALPWMALVSGASVAVLDERVDLDGGVGALLRHS
ncbi:Rv2629 family ribosome hibernation factor [Actinokineospora bangkokensis]|uniref:Peptide chain release factor 1 n=1 Tax=Actinokineospora bangkokensis TaxID=1193682 RepID=A0A1Q9LNS4_9PSEU|nr:Vms1/Ankzf1 family peptidyl-tRNA hydrolase [Actinokineospora bangkokensis]OLR93653.1 hypothetical protein BJP25_15395 [Actinokineospora bangkokensis]